MCTGKRLLCCFPYLLVIPLVINVCQSRVVFDINKEKTRSLKRTEDASLAAVVPKLPFPVFGNNVNRFYFRTSGFITFHAPTTSQPADTSGIRLSYITPFWADVNEQCVGDIKLRESLLSQEFQTARDVIVDQRAISKFKANYMLLVEWSNMLPGHCYYPRTQFQAALVTDGCASYVIFSTSSIRLGTEESTIAGDIRAEENQVVPLGGENICTGQDNGDVVLNPLDSTNRTYYRCGRCSAGPLQTCPSGQKYDMQCKKCVLKAFPNCSSSDSRCNGRSDGYVLGLEGHNDCTGYYECQTQVGLLRKCPQKTYFNGTVCMGNLDVLTCQHPDCLPGGRQNRGGDYPLTPGNQCSASYYHCNSSSFRTTRSCQISVTGAYFGLKNNAWQCISGNAPLLCGYPDYVCIGKSVTLDGSLFQNDPLDSYCRGYVICTGSEAITATCGGANQFYNVTARTCQPNFPFHQGCWRDGGISSWSSWSYANGSSCSVTCGPGGIQLLQRTRSCTDPTPLGGGSTCSGVSVSELRTANCQSTPPACEVHGSWGVWVSGSCSQTCGNGTQQRTRSCTNPAPAHGGSACPGVSTSNISCNDRPCPIHGSWGVWVSESCSQTCGNGTRPRTRSCTNPAPAHGGSACPGVSTSNISCNDRPCPIHGSWGTWVNGSCSHTCGNGTRPRTRSCTSPAPAHGGAACPGASTSIISCNDRPCSIHGDWSAWTESGSCSRTCGSGVIRESRACTNPHPQFGGNPCVGITQRELKECNTQPCPVDGFWTSWVDGLCSQSCGNGTRGRTRTCTNPAPAHGGLACSGSSTSNISCNNGPCPIWSEWTPWSTCSITCGNGTVARTRNCSHNNCIGNSTEIAHCVSKCGRKICPNIQSDIDCNFETDCWFTSQNDGFQISGQTETPGTGPSVDHTFNKIGCGLFAFFEASGRSSGFTSYLASGLTMLNQSDVCFSVYVSMYSSTPVDMGSLSVYLVENRTHEQTLLWEHSGVLTNTAYEWQQINIDVNYAGSNAVYFLFKAIRGLSFLSDIAIDDASLTFGPCTAPVNGSWSEWGSWGTCNVSCEEAGKIYRYRNCSSPAPRNGGRNCTGSSVDTQACPVVACPTHGNWTIWSNWTMCSKSCNNGTRVRIRECHNPPPAHGGDNCTRINGTKAVNEVEMENCNSISCFSD